MDQLIDRILALQKATAILEPDSTAREQLIDSARKYAHQFLDALKHMPAYRQGAPARDVFMIDGAKIEMDEALKIVQEEVVEYGIKPASGGHFGYVPGGGIYASSIGDYLAAVTNEYSGIQYASPGGARMEDMVVEWLRDIFHFPESTVGTLTSGGSIANLIGLTAARDKHNVKGSRIEKSVIYMSEQVHHCVNKALRIIGLGDVLIRYIRLDELHRMDPQHLEEQILEDQRAGLFPYLVVASAGTTDTGAVDPLKAIGQIASKHKLWYHIDGAYGGFFILTDTKKHLFEGIEMADSLVIDPHKSLFLPYGIAAVLVKDRDAVLQSNHYTANYMRDAYAHMDYLNASDISPELTRHFRGLRMWLPLKLYGIEPFKACLEEKLLLLQYMCNKLVDMGFNIGPEPDLSITYFWYPTHDENENAFNQELLKYMHQDGRTYFSSTTLNGKFVIRVAIVSFRSKLEHANLGLQMIGEALERVNG